MTYHELKIYLNELTDEQLEDDVTVVELGEAFAVKEIREQGREDDFGLANDHIILIL